MAVKNQVIYDIERCVCRAPDACTDCSKRKAGFVMPGCMEELMRDALELLKNEPSTSTEDTSYQRLMAMNRDMIERNTRLAEEAQKLARFNDNLTRLCEALMKKVYADERS